ncbi:MAG: hypothetical protein RIR65_2004, partial [Planctomycetota bacterium]
HPQGVSSPWAAPRRSYRAIPRPGDSATGPRKQPTPPRERMPPEPMTRRPAEEEPAPSDRPRMCTRPPSQARRPDGCTPCEPLVAMGTSSRAISIQMAPTLGGMCAVLALCDSAHAGRRARCRVVRLRVGACTRGGSCRAAPAGGASRQTQPPCSFGLLLACAGLPQSLGDRRLGWCTRLTRHVPWFPLVPRRQRGAACRQGASQHRLVGKWCPGRRESSPSSRRPGPTARRSPPGCGARLGAASSAAHL